MADDFSFQVHPFRFSSASGLTPHLKYHGGPRPPPGSGRDRLRGVGDSMPHSSFGGRKGDSRVWLTPRSTTAVKRDQQRSGYASGSLTERSSRPSNSGPLIPTTREAGRKKLLRSQAVQGMTWRFLKQGAPPAEPKRVKSGETRTSSHASARGGGGDFGVSEHEKAFEALIGGGGGIRDEYAKFEEAVRKRVEAVSEAEGKSGESYRVMGKEAKQVYNNMPVIENEEVQDEDEEMSSSSSDDDDVDDDDGNDDDDDELESGPKVRSSGRAALPEPVSTQEAKRDEPAPRVLSRNDLIDFGDDDDDAGGRAPPKGVTRLDLTAAGVASDEYTPADDVPLSTGRGYVRSRRGGVGPGLGETSFVSISGSREGEKEEEEEDEEDDEEEDDDGLANPNTAPCIIWHTPMRVKIAANLPQELRDELEKDTTFVRDDRVVPDIWDQKFLPVSRRSVAAPIPENTPRSRALKYGAWYLPVNGWGKGATDKAKQSGGGGGDDVAGLMDKMEKEIVKLSSSKMFYNYIKSEKLRVPHYLRKMEEKPAD